MGSNWESWIRVFVPYKADLVGIICFLIRLSGKTLRQEFAAYSVNVHKLADVEDHGAKILQRSALGQAGLGVGEQFTVFRFGGGDFVDEHIVLG